MPEKQIWHARLRPSLWLGRHGGRGWKALRPTRIRPRARWRVAGIRTVPDQEAASRASLMQIVASQRERQPLPAYTEERTIKAMDGVSLTLDRPLDHHHLGAGDFRGEVADLSRNVIVESANPA